IMLLLVGIFDSRLNIFLKFYRPISFYIENFLVVFLTYLYIKSEEDLLFVYRKILLFLTIMCIYGLSNYITQSNEYYSFIVSSYGGRDFASDNMQVGSDVRFRISSVTWHAIYYGFVLSTSLLLSVFVFLNVKLNKVDRRNLLITIL